MTVNRILRGMAGLIISISIAMGVFVSEYWFILTAFVGLNLLQSAFTNWCPAMWALRKAGIAEN